MAQKPITMLMDEFKENLTNLLNESKLPAWVLLYLLDPFVKQLQMFDQAAREQDKENYENALKEEEKGEEDADREL